MKRAWQSLRSQAPRRSPWNLLTFSLGFAKQEIFGGLRWSWAKLLDNLLAVIMGVLRLVLFLAMRLVLLVALIPAAIIGLLSWIRRWTFDVAWNALERIYPQVLRVALAVPLVIIALVGLLGWGAYQKGTSLGIELLPEIHQGEFTAFMTLEVGTPIELSQAVFR